MFKNSTHRYGRIAIFFHWLSAIVIISQFILGLYMLSLDYYHPYYKTLPDYHKSIGILFALLLLLRILWSTLNPRPSAVAEVRDWEHQLARWGQAVMLALLLTIVSLGYLISTADGASISVFGWFSVPATLTNIGNQEQWAGKWHHYLSVLLIVIASLHGLAALKHHFINKDRTLLRMLGR